MHTFGNTARIEFLLSTRDAHGQIIHQAGEVIDGELLGQKHDFLLVRTTSGSYMYLDTTRNDLYSVKLGV